ncbi:FAD-dependent oxidoreductase, partial [Patescibacteria group bacterium]|nr:FAD-dependent oxidoreductase [Patescibacteria group bacterium]
FMEFKNLFFPVSVGNLKLKNRVVMAPMDPGFTDADGSISERLIDYYEERAKGGVGMIITQFTAVVNDQRMDSPGVYSDRLTFGLNYLAETVKLYGTRIFLQIAHHGGRATRRVTGKQPVAPSSISSKIYKDIPRELTKNEIEGLIEKFVQSSQRAKMAGFDGVEVHGAHTYLIGQFISPHTNRRKDEYGGDFQGRMKFPREIVKGIKRVCGDSFPVGFKFSAYEHLENGVKIDLAKEIAKSMEEVGVDYLHVASTTYDLDGYRYPDVPPVYAQKKEVIELAKQIKAKVAVPIIAGGGINDPVDAEKILREKKVDIIAIGRALIADPEWTIKAKKGKLEKIVPCIRCNMCHKRLFAGKEVRCTVNSAVGRERKYQIKESDVSKKVVVIGAGPAGMETALVAAKRGHRVVLYEKENQLGGNMILSSVPHFKKDVAKLLEYYQKKIKKGNIQVKLGKEATLDTLVNENPDVVVLATGAKQIIPEVDGIKADNVIVASELLKDKDITNIGDEIIVLGAGLVGCETAWYLSSREKSVKLVDIVGLDDILSDEHPTNRSFLLHSLKEQDIPILEYRKLKSVEKKKVTFERKDNLEETYPMDNLIIAIGFQANTSLKEALKDSKIECEIYTIGDCKQPRDFYNAIQEGSFIARQV